MNIADRHKSLYSQIPTFSCKPGCHECCGPVPVSEWETEQIGIENTIDLGIRTTAFTKKASCKLLGPDGCMKYDQRPLLCRLFGTVQGMTCPHGCRPFLGGLSSDQEVSIMKLYHGLLK